MLHKNTHKRQCLCTANIVPIDVKYAAYTKYIYYTQYSVETNRTVCTGQNVSVSILGRRLLVLSRSDSLHRTPSQGYKAPRLLVCSSIASGFAGNMWQSKACVRVLVSLLVLWLECSSQSAIGYAGQEQLAVFGKLSYSLTLPGYLESPTSVFRKNGQVVRPASHHLYEVTHTRLGYQVTIRFLTCNDEGRYVFGGERFTVIATPIDRGLYYYTAKARCGTGRTPCSVTESTAVITPLDGVGAIYTFHVETPDIWRVIEIWNHTMSPTERLTGGCFITPNGTAFVGRGNVNYKYFMYTRRSAKADQSCSQVSRALDANPDDTPIDGPATGSTAKESEHMTPHTTTWCKYYAHMYATITARLLDRVSSKNNALLSSLAYTDDDHIDIPKLDPLQPVDTTKVQLYAILAKRKPAECHTCVCLCII